MAHAPKATGVRLTGAGKQALAELVSLTEAENKLPGFAVAVTNIDEQLFASGGGNKVFGEPSSGKVTPESMFWICSLTKLITSIAALQLIEQGKLSVGDPVSKYIPQFTKVVVLEGDYMSKEPRPYRPANEVITVGHLLNHSSGLGYFTRNPEYPYSSPTCSSIEHGPRREATSERFIQLLQEEYPGIPSLSSLGRHLPMDSTPISLVSSLRSKQTIFEPVGMKSTTFKLTEESNQTLVGMSFRNTDGSVSPWANHTRLNARYPEEVNFDFGGVGAYSTLPDYATLLRHILRIEAGQEVENPVLKPDTIKTLFQPSLGPPGSAALGHIIKFCDATANTEGLNWGNAFALVTQDWPGRRKAGTGFWFGYAGLSYLIDPVTGIAIVVGSQIIPTMDAGAVTLFNKVEDIVYANLA